MFHPMISDPPRQEVLDHIKQYKKDTECIQWISKVNAFSTEYSNGNWSHKMIRGPPIVWPSHADDLNAWSAVSPGNQEFLEFEYPEAVRPTKMISFETYFPGCIQKISCLIIKDGIQYTNWTTLWTWVSAPTFNPNCSHSASNVFLFGSCDFYAKTFRLDIDETGWSSHFQLDAVCLLGRSFPKSKTGLMNASIKSLIHDLHYFDVTFEVEGKEIKAHKVLFASRSEVFHKMFTLDMKEKKSTTIPIKGIRHDIFVKGMEWLYSESIERIDSKDILEIYLFANQYEIKDLQEWMKQLFVSNLDPKTILSVYFDQVVVFKALDLKNVCFDFIADNKEILLQPEFAKLEKEEILEIISRIGNK